MVDRTVFFRNQFHWHGLPLIFYETEGSKMLTDFRKRQVEGNKKIGNPLQKSTNFRFWQGHKDLNPEPTVLETAALPIELYPYMLFKKPKA